MPSATPAAMRWQLLPFDDLSARQLYDAMRLRAEVFVVEQQCVFSDPDGHDPRALHLLGWRDGAPDEPPALLAYARIFPPGALFDEASIGRVVTSPSARGTGLGRALMAEAMNRTRALFPDAPVKLAAQQRLERFYTTLGFRTVSKAFLEDGIVHVYMVRP
jgi:ElaA protein